MQIDMQRLDAATRVAHAAQEASDKIVLDAVQKRMQELFPDHDSWVREFVGYDDMVGGDWYCRSVKIEEDETFLGNAEGEMEEVVMEINDALSMLFEWGESGEQIERKLKEEES